MNTQPWLTPWIKTSYDRFLQERLPELLAQRLPLAGYKVEPEASAIRTRTFAYNYSPVEWAPAADVPATCRVTVTLSAASGLLTLVYPGICQPDADGLFELDGELRWVPPTAANEYLETAEIACVGEHLYDLVAAKLGQAPEGLPWDEALARAWLPLDAWINGFVRARGQYLDQTNWLSRHTHNRRLVLLRRSKVYAPGQNGRVCPFETPEGPYIGQIFTPAVGAQIQDNRLVITDPRPAATLGLSASMLPFIENNDPNRILMAANGLRQAVVPAQAEPAWVQTGCEPDAPGFWTGRNLLTAFVSWGEGTSEDAIILSASAAQRLNDPFPLEVGDKLANRHGAFGVVSQILPDEQMPHLPDGTPVELVFNFIGLRTRMQVGMLREAAASRVARAEGKPFVAPPFAGPRREELRARMAQAGLDESGMLTLRRGQNGPSLERPSTVGWIYWNRLVHRAGKYLQVSLDGQGGSSLGEMEALALRELGAGALLAEMLNTTTAHHPDAASLAERLAKGPLASAQAPSPLFITLAGRLRMAGIQAELRDGQLRFGFASPVGKTLQLAKAMPHPWLPGHSLAALGIPDGKEGEGQAFMALAEANTRLERLLASSVPGRLLQEAESRLQAALAACLDTLVPPDGYWPPEEVEHALPWAIPPQHGAIPELLRIDEPQCFSARGVAAPGIGLSFDQVSLPEEICWQLFAPLLRRELGSEALIGPENPIAVQTLDALMARYWVILYRSPAVAPTALLAFHPRRAAERVIRFNPCLGEWLNTDFDGDVIGLHLPLTAAAQEECGRLLSVQAQLARDPAAIHSLHPSQDAVWGLAYHALSAAGKGEIAALFGVAPAALPGLLTREDFLNQMAALLARTGVSQTLQTLQALANLGYRAAQDSGASMSPWIGASLRRPPAPEDDNLASWERYNEQLDELILACADYTDPELGPQLLDTHVRPQRWRATTLTLGTRGIVVDETGSSVIIKHGHSEGLSVAEMLAITVGARNGLHHYITQAEQLGSDALRRSALTRLTVLARARRARQPGIVFARAAANQEIDPLADPESRLLVGLPL
jgi:hypothetical protein